jgi:hypothetical protein
MKTDEKIAVSESSPITAKNIMKLSSGATTGFLSFASVLNGNIAGGP